MGPTENVEKTSCPKNEGLHLEAFRQFDGSLRYGCFTDEGVLIVSIDETEVRPDVSPDSTRQV